MKIIGAGMAGLIAANILRKHQPVIIEAKDSLPNNHTAVLRHKTEDISKATSIPFKQVSVIKCIYYDGNYHDTPTPRMINEYSRKVSFEYSNRSISKLEYKNTRFISPNDFLDKLAMGCYIQFSTQFNPLMLDGNPVISTMPVPVLLKELGELDALRKFEFNYSSVITITAEIDNCDLHETIYFPSDSIIPYRISIVGNKVIFETNKLNESNERLQTAFTFLLYEHFSISANEIKNIKINTLKFGKINNLQNYDELKTEIGQITRKYNIYSLGRFALWKNIMLDDIVKDVSIIEKMISSKGYYTGK